MLVAVAKNPEKTTKTERNCGLWFTDLTVFYQQSVNHNPQFLSVFVVF